MLPEAAPLPSAVARSVAGGSAQAEYDKRHARHLKKVESKWGTGAIGQIAKAVIDEPQHVTAWKKGAEGEKRLSDLLHRQLGEGAVVLDDLSVPGTKANVDHIVVAASGVWIVDAKNYKGKVEMRSGGTWRKRSVLLFVNGRDRSKLIDMMGWQVDAVSKALDAVGVDSIPIRPALCFINSDFPLFGGTGLIRDVWVGHGRGLVREIRKDHALAGDQVQLIAAALAQQLPAIQAS